MSKPQVSPETQQFLKLRADVREQLLDGLTQGDFAAVEPQPYADAPQGEFGFPVSEDMEATIVEGHTTPETDLVCTDQISLFLQIDAIEAFRRAYLAQRQTKRHMLRHLVNAVTEESKYDDLFLQRVVGIEKRAGSF